MKRVKTALKFSFSSLEIFVVFQIFHSILDHQKEPFTTSKKKKKKKNVRHVLWRHSAQGIIRYNSMPWPRRGGGYSLSAYHLYGNFGEIFPSNGTGIFLAPKTGTGLSCTIYKIPLNFFLSLFSFRKISTAMNHSIWILLEMSGFSIQMIGAPYWPFRSCVGTWGEFQI